jgi:sterol desaturase/sphingolipid hydroxylase (fatty acid hydroxylase superfamily)
MHDLVLFAVPFFIVFLVLEAVSFKIAKAEEGVVGYERRDTATSLTMGLGSVVIGAVWALVVIVFYAALYTISPLRMPTDQVWPWVLLFFLDDLAFYAYHRISHEVRVFWASHVVHHSSQHYNLSTALRQPWVPITAVPFWAPLALLGYQPWMIFAMQSVSLIYQFFLHTERIHRLPRPIELIFNTPSHHRVHHGTNDLYLDRNYGGMLIIWDRIFGSFEPEDEKAVYGLTTNIETFNPVRVAFHEYVAVWHDVRGARGLRNKLGYLFGGPGWRPGDKDRGLAGAQARAASSGPKVAAWKKQGAAEPGERGPAAGTS